MRTLTHSHLLAALLLGSACLTACSTKDEALPAPVDPAPAFTLGHYFDFTTSTPGGSTAHSGSGEKHAPQDITGTAHLDATGNVLALDFTAAPDEVYFELDQAQLRPGWTGTYDLRCKARPTDPVFSSYLYTESGGSTAILRLSDWSQELTGSVTITAYDAKRHLLSGSYEVTAPAQRDPRVPGSSTQSCTISLAGDFTNLKVK